MKCNLSRKTFACAVRQKNGEKKNRNVMYETYVDFYPIHIYICRFLFHSGIRLYRRTC